MSGHDMRKSALRRYIVFRVKAIEFMDIAFLRDGIKSGRIAFQAPVGRQQKVFADALRTVQLSFFALFVDKHKDGTNVIELWKELFPKHKSQINAAWTRMESSWPLITEFRDRAGFHAQRHAKKFFEARRKILRNPKVDTALSEFIKLLRAMLELEATELPDLETTLDSLLDELEGRHGGHYNRPAFKQYLLIPDTSKPIGTGRPRVGPA